MSRENGYIFWIAIKFAIQIAIQVVIEIIFAQCKWGIQTFINVLRLMMTIELLKRGGPYCRYFTDNHVKTLYMKYYF